MPSFPSFPALSSFGTAVLAISTSLAGPALAQVTTSQGALDRLGGDHARHAAPEHSRSTHHTSGRRSSRDTGSPDRKAHSAPSGRPAPAATIPAAPPAAPVFRAPVINVPLHPPPPPPPVPVVPNATGTVSTLPDGTRITFGAGSADLNPATMAALHAFADRLKADPTLRVDLDSSATGTADDPSTPRRLSLDRPPFVCSSGRRRCRMAERSRRTAAGPPTRR